ISKLMISKRRKLQPRPARMGGQAGEPSNEWCAGLDAEECGFRVGKIAKARPRWPAEEFRQRIVEVMSDETGDRAVRVKHDQRQRAHGETPPERHRKPHRIRDIAAVDELRARNGSLDEPWSKDERERALARHAPQTDTAGRRVLGEQLAL